MPDSPPPPETLAWLRQSASCGKADAQLTLHILERLEALEKKYETQRLATLEWGKDVDKLLRWIDDHLKRIMALEQRPIPGFAELAAQPPAPQPAPPVAPAGGLVERLACLIADRFSESRLGTDCRPFGREVIREVAEWIRLELNGRSVADRLEQEADR